MQQDGLVGYYAGLEDRISLLEFGGLLKCGMNELIESRRGIRAGVCVYQVELKNSGERCWERGVVDLCVGWIEGRQCLSLGECEFEMWEIYGVVMISANKIQRNCKDGSRDFCRIKRIAV